MTTSLNCLTSAYLLKTRGNFTSKTSLTWKRALSQYRYVYKSWLQHVLAMWLYSNITSVSLSVFIYETDTNTPALQGIIRNELDNTHKASGTVVLTRGQFAPQLPQGIFNSIWKYFGLSQLKDANGILWVEAKNASQHPTCTEQHPTTKCQSWEGWASLGTTRGSPQALSKWWWWWFWLVPEINKLERTQISWSMATLREGACSFWRTRQFFFQGSPLVRSERLWAWQQACGSTPKSCGHQQNVYHRSQVQIQPVTEALEFSTVLST